MYININYQLLIVIKKNKKKHNSLILSIIYIC